MSFQIKRSHPFFLKEKLNEKGASEEGRATTMSLAIYELYCQACDQLQALPDCVHSATHTPTCAHVCRCGAALEWVGLTKNQLEDLLDVLQTSQGNVGAFYSLLRQYPWYTGSYRILAACYHALHDSNAVRHKEMAMGLFETTYQAQLEYDETYECEDERYEDAGYEEERYEDAGYEDAGLA